MSSNQQQLSNSIAAAKEASQVCGTATLQQQQQHMSSSEYPQISNSSAAAKEASQVYRTPACT
jgi:hypothetical protein